MHDFLRCNRSFNSAWSCQAQGRQKVGYRGTGRHQSLHRREDGLQGEARLGEGSRHAAQVPQEHGQLIIF